MKTDSLSMALVAALRDGTLLPAQKIKPLEALLSLKPPFAVYAAMRESERMALDGPTGLKEREYEVLLVESTTAGLYALAAKAKSAAISLQGTAKDNLSISSVSAEQSAATDFVHEQGYYTLPLTIKISYEEE